VQKLITPARLRHFYESIAKSPPCITWKLPSADKVTIKVARVYNAFGMFEDDPYTITICPKHCTTLLEAFETMAHEMVHLKRCVDKDPDWDDHEEPFRKLAAEICQAWGFDSAKF